MSFWDEYKEVGGNFIKAEEKQVLIDNGIPLTVTSVIVDEDNKFGPRFVAKVQVPDPETGEEEDRNLSFPKGSGADSRDRMLSQLESYLERDDAEPVVVKLVKVGRAILIEKA